jgi:hypothetical protein
MMWWCVEAVRQKKAQPAGGNGGTSTDTTDFEAASVPNAMTRSATTATVNL